ncbi:hypothetical protein EDD11_000928 [Mortierella claussenii]|nr:hypothetical protein EDD11_000928 [Mortierella claussenii]
MHPDHLELQSSQTTLLRPTPLHHPDGPAYLADLASHLPLSASMFGLVLTTLLDPVEPISLQQHYRSTTQLALGAQDGATSTTVADIAISKRSITIYAHCEALLMQAAVLQTDGQTNTAVYMDGVPQELAIKQSISRYQAKSADDLILNRHFQATRSLIEQTLERHSTEFGLFSSGSKDLKYNINGILAPPLASGIKGTKFTLSECDLVKSEPEFRTACQQLERNEGLILGHMTEDDVKLMIEVTEVKYDEEYGRHIIRRSQCFRNRDGKMVAWAGTHDDFSIAALPVLPPYRKMGLGKLVLESIARVHVALAREPLAAAGDEKVASDLELYAHADCVEHNTRAIAFMKRCGWRPVGNFLWTGVLPKSCNHQPRE